MIGREVQGVLEVVAAGGDLGDEGVPARLRHRQSFAEAVQVGEQLAAAGSEGDAHRAAPAGCRSVALRRRVAGSPAQAPQQKSEAILSADTGNRRHATIVTTVLYYRYEFFRES